MKDREYHRTYSREYYHRTKQELIKLLGKKCKNCGSTQDLQFDHIDPNTKSFSVGKLLNHRRDRILDELQKCQLLCKQCHIVKTKKENPHVKLTIEDVNTIRHLCIEKGISQSIVAKQFGISQPYVSDICRYLVWKI